MKKEEIMELKMLLFEEISNVKDSINIPEIKNETEILFAVCSSISKIDNFSVEERDMLLKANVHATISTYYLRPELDLQKRIPFVQGVIYVASSYPILNSNPCFKDLSIEEKLVVLINEFDSQVNNNCNIDNETLYYIHSGMAMELKLYEQKKDNNNGHKGKRRRL